MTRPRHLQAGVMECDVNAVVAESECKKVTDFFVYLAEMFVQWLRQRRKALGWVVVRDSGCIVLQRKC